MSFPNKFFSTNTEKLRRKWKGISKSEKIIKSILIFIICSLNIEIK